MRCDEDVRDTLWRTVLPRGCGRAKRLWKPRGIWNQQHKQRFLSHGVTGMWEQEMFEVWVLLQMLWTFSSLLASTHERGIPPPSPRLLKSELFPNNTKYPFGNKIIPTEKHWSNDGGSEKPVGGIIRKARVWWEFSGKLMSPAAGWIIYLYSMS